jgi:exosortase
MSSANTLRAQAITPSASQGGRADLVAFGVLCAIVGAAFFPTLVELVAYWSAKAEYSHGFLMPVVAAWFLWERRADFRRLAPRPSAVGLVLLTACLGLLLLGEMKLSWFLKPFAFVGSLVAVTWGVYGRRAVALALPAVVALLLMCPLPGRVQDSLSVPLKHSAALLATGLLDLSGIPASLEGNVIHLPALDDLWVADACSGIRSLIALVSLAIIACFLRPAHWLYHVAVVVAAVPIAILVNGLRIWLTGVLSVKVGPETAEGFFHFFEGFALFAVAALLLWGWAVLLRRFFPGSAP